jgi:hypothetical protein
MPVGMPRFINSRACWGCGTGYDSRPVSHSETGNLFRWGGRLKRRCSTDQPWVCESCTRFAAEIIAGLPRSTADQFMRAAKWGRW